MAFILVQPCVALTLTLEATGAQLWRDRGFEGFQLHGRVSAGVDLRRLQAGMAKPKGDLPQVFGGLEDCHRAGVPQDMRRHSLRRQRSATFFGRTNVLPEDVFKPGTSHRSVAGIDK